MGDIANRLVATIFGGIALIAAVRAAVILSALISGGRNFLPVPRTADGCPICPPQTFFSGETEQILTILVSSIVCYFAWNIWHRTSKSQ